MKALSFTKLLVCMMLCLCVVLLASCRNKVEINQGGSNEGENDSSTETEYVRPFKEFSDVNTKNSFLGYGIDIINTSGISTKNILLNYPIFDMEKLQDEMLLYNYARGNTFQSIEGETIQTFVESMSNSTSVSAGTTVAAKGNIKGVDAGASVSMSGGLATSFSKASSSVQSQYFLEIIGENQSYWLILQSSEARYKEMLSEEFKRDLYNSNMHPSLLFQKYGTHLLTSVAMGGSVSMYYTLYSYEETDMTSQYAKVSAEIKQNVNAAYGKYSGSVDQNMSFENTFTYTSTATQNGIFIDEKIVCNGGGAYGINNATTLYDNYYEWQKSLDNYPVVMGIKDANSLYPIWDLIDLTVDGAEERYNELYDYFVEYGIESLEALYETYEITPPILPDGITNVKINGDDYSEGSMPQTKAGSTVRISFDPTPANANMYKKTYSVYSNADTDKYKAAVIDENGVMTVDNNVPSGTYITVTIGAGAVSKQIVFYVMNSYNVNFVTGVSGFDVDPLIGITEGSTIKEPDIWREGWQLDGWYRDAGYTEPFDFDIDRITGHTTLYAKLYQIKPVVTFDTMGGSNVASQKVAYKGFASIPNDPNRAGYTFDGWYMDADGTIPFDFSSPIVVDTTVYAKWNRVEYVVTFETNGGTFVTSATVSIDNGYKVTEPETERALHIFKGWYSDKELTKPFYFGTQITADITLYAKWEEMVFTVTYYVDGQKYGTQQTYKFGQTINYLAYPSKDGKQFSGWIWEGGSLPETMPAEDMIIEGSFDQVLFEVKYYIDGRLVDTKNVYKGFAIPDNEELTFKTGYTFSGWRMNSGDVLVDIPNNMPSYDIELHGSFTVNVYTITFENCDTSPITAEYGASIKAPATPTRVGYTFKSWDKKIPSNMPAEDIVITAQWSNNQYSIRYDVNSEGLKGEFAVNGYVDSVIYESTSVVNIATSQYGKYYTFDGWFTAPTGGVKIASSNGQLEKDVSGYTDSTGKWIYTGEVALYAHWTKTRDDYTYISSLADLEAIKNDTHGKYLIIDDLNLEGNRWTPIDLFYGTLDGDGHCIYNFFINSNGTAESQTIIGFIAKNYGRVMNLTIGKSGESCYGEKYSVEYVVQYTEKKKVECNLYVGVIVGQNMEDAYITDCNTSNVYVNALFKDDNNNEHLCLCVGGIAAKNNGYISRCSLSESYLHAKATAAVDGGDNNYVWLGGICAINYSIIMNSTASDSALDIYAQGDGNKDGKNNIAYPAAYIGGIIGEQINGTLSSSKVTNITFTKHVTKTGNTKGEMYDKTEVYGKHTGGAIVN